MKQNYESASPSIQAANYPLAVNDAAQQAETGNPKGYMIKNDKMPTIQFTHSNEPAIVKDAAPRVTPDGKLARQVDAVRPMDENLHTKFVKPNELDSPSSMGRN